MGRWSFLVCMLASGCGDGRHGDNGGHALKASLDLTHTIGFAIADMASKPAVPANGDDAGACMPSNLYALQDNGDLVVTTVTETTTDAGASQCDSSMQTEMAAAVFDTTAYEVITYANGIETSCEGGQCTRCMYVVLRKSDGALFCGGTQVGSNLQSVKGEGDVLYVEDGGGLTRLDMSVDPPQATVVDDTQSTGDFIQGIDVNAADDALAAGSFGERVFKSTGGLQNINTVMGAYQWLDPAGDFYYAYGNNAGPPPNGFLTYHLSSGSYTQTLVGDFDQLTGGGGGFAMATSTQAYAWGIVGGASLLIDLLPSAAGGICRDGTGGPLVACTDDTPCAGTCAGTPTTCNGGPNDGQPCGTDANCNFTCSLSGAQHLLVGVPTVESAIGTGSQLYVRGADTFGNGMIVQVDTSAIQETACCTTSGCCASATCCSAPITPTTLLAAGEYTVNAISLSRTGELTFAGLRNSDGASVIGNCAGGSCTIVNAVAPTVSALTRID